MSPNYLPWLLSVQLLLHLAEITAKVPAIIIFGDSSVDAGNNNYIPTIARSNFKPYGRDFIGGQPTGRFCNGRLATDFISEAFGLPPTVPAYLDPACGIKDFAAGVCFASAGSGFDNATSDVLVSPWGRPQFSNINSCPSGLTLISYLLHLRSPSYLYGRNWSTSKSSVGS